MYFAAGEHRLNLKHLEEAVSAADASGDPVTMTEIAMQQCHVLSRFGGDPRQAVHVGRRALEMADRLEDEALAYGVRFALGHACWIGGDYGSVIELLSANLPENMRDPTQIRDFGTGSCSGFDVDSRAYAAHRGDFDRAFAILERARAFRKRMLSIPAYSKIITLRAFVSRRRGFGGPNIASSDRAGDPRWGRVYSALASGVARLRSCAQRRI